MRRIPLRGVAYAAVIGVTVLVVYFATRRGGAPAEQPASHAHGDVATSESRAVMLDPEEARRIGVTYAAVRVGTLESEVRTVGQITADETRVRTIAPKIDGWVERLFVNATGQYVSAGDPLFTIYAPMLVTAQEELLLAKRLQKDVASGSADVQRNAADLLTSARRRLAYWDIPETEIAEIERAGEVRRTLTLRSPVSGYVSEKNVVAGQRIMAGDALYRVTDLSTVWVEGEVFEQDLAAVHLGQTVHAEFQALPGEHRMGRIAYVYPTVNPATRTARVRVVLPNTDTRLKPGMYATLRITGRARTGVLNVPRDAVLSTGERAIVFVKAPGGHLAPREVGMGAATDDRVEILRGLAAGDTVVASATFLVDAESNLGKALGGMGNMPGMDVSQPPAPLPMQPTQPTRAPATAGAPKPDLHTGHQSP